MTIIKFLVFIRACEAIEHFLFVASFSTMFHTTVSSAEYTFQRHIFLQNMESTRIVSKKGIWRIRRGGQGTNRFFRVNRDVIWEQIWGLLVSLILGWSIIDGDGR